MERGAGNEQTVSGSDEHRPEVGQDNKKHATGHKPLGTRSAFQGVAWNGLEKFQLGALLHPDHTANMDRAVWVFLWLWGNAKVDKYPRSGEVFEGRPFSLELIAEDLDMSPRTVRRYMARLRAYGYVDTWREGPGGISAAVHIWRPGQTEAPATDDEGPEGQRTVGVSDAGDSKPTRQNLVRQTKAANSGSITDEEKNTANSGRSFENAADKSGRFTNDKSAKSGRSFAENAEFCVPPLLTPPYNEFVKRVYKEPTTTTVVPFERGKPGTVPVAAGVAEVSQGGECRRVSPASKALDKELSLIPGHERPIRTKTLERAFLDLSPHDIGLVFDAVRRERTSSTWLDNPPGWWASLLHEQAWALKKQRSKERNEEGDL